MKVVSAEQMRELERRAAEIGLPPPVLMDKAGLSVARQMRDWLGSVLGRRILVLVGPGNNGGDGLVAARHLHDWGAQVRLYLGSPRAAADANFALIQQRGLPFFEAAQDEGLAALGRLLPWSEVVLDAFFGTGKSRPLEGRLKEVLEATEKARRERPLKMVALDLPSGLDADTGAVDEVCPPADLTITLGYPKLGLFAFPGSDYVGELRVGDIGLPEHLAQDIPFELLTADWARSVLPRRPRQANKGTFGRVMVVAASPNYLGAAALACTGALRVGAGLVTLAVARSLQPILASQMTETTYLPLPEVEPGLVGPEAAHILHEGLAQYDVLLLGCGLGQHPSVASFVIDCLLSHPHEARPALVLDADGLNLLSRVPQWWQRLPSGAIVTPHPGEMARLTGLPLGQIQEHRLQVARETAATWEKVVVLKGAHTIVASPEGKALISPFANAGLASAGTGDVLAGAIAGLLAQGLSPLEAAAGGVYLHAQAGELAKAEMGEAGMLAGDLLPRLPLVIKALKAAQR